MSWPCPPLRLMPDWRWRRFLRTHPAWTPPTDCGQAVGAMPARPIVAPPPVSIRSAAAIAPGVGAVPLIATGAGVAGIGAGGWLAYQSLVPTCCSAIATASAAPVMIPVRMNVPEPSGLLPFIVAVAVLLLIKRRPA